MRVTSSPVIESRMIRLLGNTASALTGAIRPSTIEHPEHVGAELDAGADLLELGRLLDDLRRDALALQRQGRGQPADAAADDEDWLVPPIGSCAFPPADIVEADRSAASAAAACAAMRESSAGGR